ncbi:methionine ABC transporter substrate-binding protein [Clostridium sp. KNHs214]|uniref:lysine 5,6-aminomutase reactivase ATPase KamC n=1 Tax=Clostridium sp. KNHs214 TaxID=1540257 RepID=UPI00054F398E|nr:methionine ABC transporter substrate-binding protein [Clostridium sp. KNHs214]
MRFLDENQKAQVGFEFIMDELNVMTCYGRDKKKNLKPFLRKDKDKLIHELGNLEKVTNSLKEHEFEYGKIECAFCKVKDIRNSIKRCKELNALDDVELFEIKSFCSLVNEIIDAMNNLHLDISELCLEELNDAFKLLDPENKKMPTFYIYDAYSYNLKEIREKKRALEERILIEMDEEKIKILKEERLNYVVLEDKEEFKIRKELTKKLASYTEKLDKDIHIIGALDLLMAKGKMSIKYRGIKPCICDDMRICLKNAVNPQIEELLERKGKEFTPISVDLREGVSIITGANMGGKSVTLKTAVLNVFLGNMGFFVFCEEAIIPNIDFIGFISDDMQSISKGLSTFGAEIIKLNSVMECAKRWQGFIVLDEFARGTNPKEGCYLVKALCRYLNKFNSVTLISTHYDGVVEKGMVHYQVVGLKNVNFEILKRKIDLNKRASVEIIQEHMDYRLERVSRKNKVPKDALNIATLLGIEEGIVDIIKEFYAKGDDHGK